MLKELTEAAGDDLIVTCDVGQHQMWVAQHCRFSRPQAHLTSAGLGTMGYGIPAGIGALLAEPDATVVTVTGDGSIMMNIQELATLRRYRLPLKILLLDNSQLGMVRQWQELFFNENFSEIDLTDNPDFAEVARAVRDRGVHHRLSLARCRARSSGCWPPTGRSSATRGSIRARMSGRWCRRTSSNIEMMEKS